MLSKTDFKTSERRGGLVSTSAFLGTNPPTRRHYYRDRRVREQQRASTGGAAGRRYADTGSQAIVTAAKRGGASGETPVWSCRQSCRMEG